MSCRFNPLRVSVRLSLFLYISYICLEHMILYDTKIIFHVRNVLYIICLNALSTFWWGVAKIDSMHDFGTRNCVYMYRIYLSIFFLQKKKWCYALTQTTISRKGDITLIPSFHHQHHHHHPFRWYTSKCICHWTRNLTYQYNGWLANVNLMGNWIIESVMLRIFRYPS